MIEGRTGRVVVWCSAGMTLDDSQKAAQSPRILPSALARRTTQARSIRPIHSGVQRRPDLGVDHEVGQVIEAGRLPVDDHQGGPALLRERREPRCRGARASRNSLPQVIPTAVIIDLYAPNLSIRWT